MKKKLKQALFTSYEKEMNFHEECMKAKEGLSFTVKNKTDYRKHAVSVLATLAVCSVLVVSGHFAFHQFFGENDKASSPETALTSEKSEASLPFDDANDGINPGAPLKMQNGSITFHPFEGITLAFTFFEETTVLSIASSSGIRAENLAVKDDGKSMNYEDSLKGYQLEKKEGHQISWEYTEDDKVATNRFII